MAKRAKCTIVSLEKLDEVRTRLRASLMILGLQNGTKYRIRTFYYGPRRSNTTGNPLMWRPNHTPASTTLKQDATAAKIAIYKLSKGGFYDFHSYF